MKQSTSKFWFSVTQAETYEPVKALEINNLTPEIKDGLLLKKLIPLLKENMTLNHYRGQFVNSV